MSIVKFNLLSNFIHIESATATAAARELAIIFASQCLIYGPVTILVSSLYGFYSPSSSNT